MTEKRLGHPPRLKGWDYSTGGAYFITFTVSGRLKCLSTIRDGIPNLTPYGEIVHQCWLELSSKFPNVLLDEIVIMPDHTHSIIWTGVQVSANGPEMVATGILDQALINQDPTYQDPTLGLTPMMSDPKLALGKVIRAWKAKSTYLIRSNIDFAFAWQSRYYEHVIRDDDELSRIREYIAANPSGMESENEWWASAVHNVP